MDQPPPDAPPDAAPELPDNAIDTGCTPPVAPVELESAFEPPGFEQEAIAIAIANPAVVTPTATACHTLRENSGCIAPPAVSESIAQQAMHRASRPRPRGEPSSAHRPPAARSRPPATCSRQPRRRPARCAAPAAAPRIA
ncbi:hypothetical protein [Burkholderia savannae]|uniref:hypothetical protein n=1 Tax=Burkholderia savannae TaxID=1637837 RepID=UPI0012E360CF|nr:hypothetical protein [Burkholderia savannae]